jgi:hypothetical protein
VRTGELDAWLPDPAVRTHHRRTARATPDELWSAASGVRLADTRTLGRLVRWRIPGTPADLRFRELFAAYPFMLLDEGDGFSVSGLCGRIWTLTRDYPRLEDPEAFRVWDRPGTVRVLFAHWVEPDAEGRSALVSEARVRPTDVHAALALRALGGLIRTFERLIATEPLTVATARAERSARLGPPTRA